jgi:23S rRNA pseudouridine1911/1915/1917 synthase
VRIPPPQPLDVEPEAIPLRIVYEDQDLLVVDKPAGLTVHPAPGHRSHTLVNALLAHCRDLSGVGGVLRPGIVHRLDRDTSGLLLVAKNDRAHAGLSKQLKERTVEKRYLALVRGRLEQREGVIEGAIGRDPRNRKRMAIVEGGRPARTAYRVREHLEGMTLVEVAPSTGRTHQIRVHFAAAGHPIVGDALYGKPSALVGRQFLHAYRLAFRHPRDGRSLAFESPLPADLEEALSRAAGA